MKNIYSFTAIFLAFSLVSFISSDDKNDYSKVEINQNADQVLRLFQADQPDQSLISMSAKGLMHIGPNLNRSQAPSDGYYLYVEKGIRSERVKIDIAADNGWADYVFEGDYPLRSIDDLAQYISENGHLPGIPSAQEVSQEGLDLAQANKQLLEKVEELSLYVIQLNERIKDLEGK